MQGFVMKTILYDMNVKYIPDPDNTVADGLSRTPIKGDTIQLQMLQVHQITNKLKCKADRLQQLC